MSLNGKFDEPEISRGYGQLLDYLSDTGKGLVAVDTSKSLTHLESLTKAWRRAGRSIDDVVVVVVAKDPRGFAWSIQRKQAGSQSLLAALRSMNWWNGIYRQLLAYADSSGMAVAFVTYEQICRRSTQVLEKLGGPLRRSFTSDVDISHANSHIALGNKDFIERNRDRIVYDDAWKKSWRLRVAYTMNLPVRKTWRRLHLAALVKGVVEKQA